MQCKMVPILKRFELASPLDMCYMYVPNHKKYDELCIHLLKKWGDGSTGTGTGIRVTLRLPDGTKVRAVVDESCTAKVSNLYNTCIANNN